MHPDAMTGHRGAGSETKLVGGNDQFSDLLPLPQALPAPLPLPLRMRGPASEITLTVGRAMMVETSFACAVPWAEFRFPLSTLRILPHSGPHPVAPPRNVLQ